MSSGHDAGRAETKGMLSSVVGVDAQLSCANRSLKRPRQDGKGGVSEEEEEADQSPIRNCMKYGCGDVVWTYVKYHNRWRRKSGYEAHVSNCDDDRNAGDTRQRAILMAHDLVYKEKIVEV